MRWVRRPMRLGLGNAVEPAALIRRHGADALRLGCLLSLHSGSLDLATASESNLRRGRRAVRRLNAKVTGLFHLTGRPGESRREDGDGPPPLADDWIVARASASMEAARQAYREHRLGAAGRLLAEAADDLTRYAAVAAGRRRRDRGLAGVRATLTAVVERLAAGFSPICPYLFEKLTAWTAARSPGRGDAPAWVAELVAELRRRGGEALTVGSADPAVAARLTRDREELEELTGRRIRVAEPAGVGSAVGPCVIAPARP